MIDAFTYPHPRHRAAPPSLPQPEGAHLPVSHIYSGVFTLASNVRWTWTGPQLRGPAMFKNIAFYTGSHGASAQVTVEVGYTRQPVNENAVPQTTRRDVTVLGEFLANNYGNQNPGSAGILDSTQPNTFVRWSEPLDLIVDEPYFYPVISVWARVIGVSEYDWNVRIVEQLNRRALQLFRSAGQGPAPRRNATTQACATLPRLRASARSSQCSTRRRRQNHRIRGTGRTTARRST